MSTPEYSMFLIRELSAVGIRTEIIGTGGGCEALLITDDRLQGAIMVTDDAQLPDGCPSQYSNICVAHYPDFSPDDDGECRRFILFASDERVSIVANTIIVAVAPDEPVTMPQLMLPAWEDFA